jgi:transcriptional regulator with XRE-family HTH domain
MTTRKAHGPAIKAIRKALGVTQDDLAISCDVTPGYMSNVESGKKQPSEALVSAICLRLGIEKDAVMYAVETRELVAA